MISSKSAETDLGAAASALFHLHTSPLITFTGTAELQSRFLNIPKFDLNDIPIIEKSSSVETSPNKIQGRPRAATWGGGSSINSNTFTDLPLLTSLLEGVATDANAAGTLCALMQDTSSSNPPPSITTTTITRRPRSLSMSAAALSQLERQHTKGLRPRSSSVSSANNAQQGPQPIQQGASKRTTTNRPRSFSQSSRMSMKSTTSGVRNNHNNNRKRTMSVDSSVSFRREYFDSDDDDDDDDDVEVNENGELSSGSPINLDDELNKVGKYSPESRKVRIERFLEKRRRRIWRKRIKYDVRKNFADSRLRVKGRFVRKEDEEQLRGFLEIT